MAVKDKGEEREEERKRESGRRAYLDRYERASVKERPMQMINGEAKKKTCG